MNIPSNKIKDIVSWYRSQLSSIYDPGELEAIIHLAFESVLGFSRTDITRRENDNVSESDLLKLHFICKRLLRNEPIQYIVGETEFYNLKFKVTPAVLIPRQETEELVDIVIKDTLSHRHLAPFTILDIGTGSGCIAITLKKQILNAFVYAIDVSEQALALAKENAENNNAQVQFIQGDILKPEAIGLSVSGFDVIVSNPPYVTKKEGEQMDSRVKDFEPGLALFVENEDPLQFYKAICDFAKKKLNPNGRLYLELNAAYGRDTENLLRKEGFINVELIKDLSGKDRILIGEWGSE
jgi:release factor glutamine methyltransferase